MSERNRARSAASNRVEREVESFFVAQGFDVEHIPELNSQRTPDLRVSKDAEEYTVEITTKSDSGAYEIALDAGAMAEEERVQQRSSTLQRVLRNKTQQVRAPGAAGFRVLWIETLGPFREAIAGEIAATLYGRVSIPIRGTDGRNVEKYCYFFDKAECFTRRALNAVIVASDSGLQVLLNPKADTVAGFRKARMVTMLKAGVVDPEEEVALGDAFSLEDYTGPRDTSTASDRPRRAFLEKKYGLAFAIPVRWKRVTIATRIPTAQIAEQLSAGSDDEG